MSKKTAAPIVETFAARLNRLLTEAGITAYRLAQVSGLPKQTISRYLRGDREPTFDNVLRLAKSLNVPVEAFAYPVTLPEPEP